MKKLSGKSMDLKQKNIEELKKLFPEIVTEGKVDFEKLKLVLGEEIDSRQEKYEFTWHGKAKSIKIAQTPSTGTLRPDKASSKYWDETENLYIEGDNLEVLKMLQKPYFGKVKMIYIDPPYNTGNDFVYKDNYRDNIDNYKKITKQNTKSNSELSGRYHTDWLNMMYPRLKLAKNLLSQNGAIFISIDENELYNLKKICDEIFGETNYRNTILVRRRVKSLNLQFADSGLKSMNVGTEYILVYSKSNEFIMNPLRQKKTNFKEKGSWNVFWSNADRPTMRYDILGFTPSTGQWRWSKEKADVAIENYKDYLIKHADKMTLEEYWKSTGEKLKFIRKIENGKGKNGGVQYWVGPNSTSLRTTNWTDLEVSEIHKEFDLGFSNPKNVNLIKELIALVPGDDFTVLDFFAGSSTTAQAVFQLNTKDEGNRNFIMVQLPEKVDGNSDAFKNGFENICEIGQQRINLSGEKIFKENEKYNLDTGFKVFKLDTSNLKIWDPNTDNLEQNLFDLQDNIKESRTQKDLLYEILLKVGISLTAPIEQKDINGKTIFNVGYGGVLLCLEDEIDQDIVLEIIKLKPEDFDTKVIFKETGFINDSVKTNAIQTLKKNGITDVRSV